MASRIIPVSIAFACNNPNNGMFTDKFSDVRIGDRLLNLSNQYWPPKQPTLAFHFSDSGVTNGFAAKHVKGKVQISRRRFPIHGYKYGWGNWCWDLVIVTPAIAVDIINYLKELKCFHCEEGETEFFERFNHPELWFEKDDATLLRLAEDGYQRP